MWSTWDDFIAMGEKYTEATGKPFVDNVETSIFFSTVNQVTEKYYSPEGELVYDTNPQVEDAFNVAVDTYDGRHQRGHRSMVLGVGPGQGQRFVRGDHGAVVDARGHRECRTRHRGSVARGSAS